MRLQPRVKRNRSGAYELHLPEEERAILRSLPGQLMELLETDDPSVFRLFPSAYPDDPERDAEFSRLMRDDLLEHHRAALDTLASTVDEPRLDEDQAGSWLNALNQLRLVLGTRLDVTEDMGDLADDDPRAPLLAVYHYLSWLQEQLVEAMSR